MSSLQLSQFVPSPLPRSRSRHPKLRRPSSAPPLIVPLRCQLPADDDKGFTGDSSGEEPPESLFMKELKRRGMVTPTSLLEDGGRGFYGLGEVEFEYEEEEEEEEMGRRGGSKMNGLASLAGYEKSSWDRRERAVMMLNSEGLQGLIPRAKLLLAIGVTFFLGFWPLILVIIALFSALFSCFGPHFVHDASEAPYIDAYVLIDDERISQVTPHVK